MMATGTKCIAQSGKGSGLSSTTQRYFLFLKLLKNLNGHLQLHSKEAKIFLSSVERCVMHPVIAALGR